MKKVLCFGDSNIWGYIPGTDHERFNRRWPVVLRELLGKGFEITEDGLDGRTIVSDDKRPGKQGRVGAEHFLRRLKESGPFDFIALMVGTNELKSAFGRTANEIGNLLETHFIRACDGIDPLPRIILIAPPLIDERTPYAGARYRDGTEKSRGLGDVYAEVAERNACAFVDARRLAVGSDGVHMTQESHSRLAEMVRDKLLMRT